MVYETGSDQWHDYAAWPPRVGVKRRQLYFHSNHMLSFTPPAADDEPERFVSDPANPVPYRQSPIATLADKDTTWRIWQADDQAPFAKRPDVLSFQTQVLDHDVTMRGAVAASVFASTTGSDADWIVKVMDVYPEDASLGEMSGRQLMIVDDVFRGRFLRDFEHPQALVPGKVEHYSIDLHSASHVFKQGHRIAVQVQSTWFPLIDRNPQTFSPSIFEATAAQYKAQTHAVFHSAKYPSAIVFDMPQAH
jgi:putative CocE/NonD family hydrolase